MVIAKGNFKPIEIENANEEFSVIIDNLRSNKIFNSFFSNLDIDTMIAITNLDEQIAGKTTRDNRNGDKAIFFNSSIYLGLKKAFTKLFLGKDLKEIDAIYINYFVHEYLHNKQTHLFTLRGFQFFLSEGLTEIIAQRYTNNFLEVFCGNNIKYKKIDDTPIYVDVVNILKPLLKKFKNENIYDDIEDMLWRVNHNNIKQELQSVMNNYSIGLSLYIIRILEDEFKKLRKIVNKD